MDSLSQEVKLLTTHKRDVLVSLCIPTYNRCEYLNMCLKQYVKNKKFIDGSIEIVISDNASTDKTLDVVLSYKKKYHNIVYYKNRKNLKDKNFPIVLSRGRGKLRKLVSDNIVISEYGLDLLCDCVKKYYESYVGLFFDNGKSQHIKTNKYYCENIDSLFYAIGYWSTWSSGLSLWDYDCRNIFAETDDCDLRLWQVNKLCELFSKRNGIVIHERFCSLLHIKQKDVSYGIFDVFYKNYFLILNRYRNKGYITNACIDFLKKDLLYGYFKKRLFLADCGLDKNLIYKEGENLKEKVYREYAKEEYFMEYLTNYRKLFLLSKIIKFICRFVDINNFMNLLRRWC